MEDIKEILKQVKQGSISIEQAEKVIQQKNTMDFATIDWQRSTRKGYGEVIFCNGKKTAHVVSDRKSVV